MVPTTSTNSYAWDAKRAMHEEFLAIADRLLKSVSGSFGVKTDPDKMVWSWRVWLPLAPPISPSKVSGLLYEFGKSLLSSVVIHYLDKPLTMIAP